MTAVDVGVPTARDFSPTMPGTILRARRIVQLVSGARRRLNKRRVRPASRHAGPGTSPEKARSSITELLYSAENEDERIQALVGPAGSNF